jgi:hypothetical protein
MTLMRKLALCISNIVIRYASPGCKEWAEALAREVVFVEGDWAAVGWALGSARILFDYREAPIESLADLFAAAKKFAESKRNSRNATWLIMLTQGLIYCDRFSRTTSWSERTGCSLVVLGSICLGMIALNQWRSKRKVPLGDDDIALVQFYTAELKRMSDVRSYEWWLAGFGLTFFFVGTTMADRGGLHAHPISDAVMGFFWMAGILFVLQMGRINRRRLERLNALLAEKS